MKLNRIFCLIVFCLVGKPHCSTMTDDPFPFFEFYNATDHFSYHVTRDNHMCGDLIFKFGRCCSCLDECIQNNNCCIDKFWSHPGMSSLSMEEYLAAISNFTQVNNSHECKPIFKENILQKISANITSRRYMMISKCLNLVEDATKQDFEKCSNDSYETILEAIPVMTKFGVLYRSSACARCNRINDFERVNVTIRFKEGKKESFYDGTWKNNPSESILEDAQFKQYECFHQKAKNMCKEPTLFRKCMAYNSPLRNGYANYHCALCSGLQITPSIIPKLKSSCPPDDSFNEGGSSGLGAFSWSLVIDFSGKTKLFYGRNEKNSMCKDDRVYDIFTKTCVRELQKDNKDEVKQFQEVEQYISIIGTSFSIIAYLLLIATYSRFRELRNLPGLNAMAMFIALLLTDVLAISRRADHVTSCKYLGIRMHYFYLVSQMWVAIICLDLAKTFHSSVTMATNNKTKTFLKYCGIAFSLPLLFVLPSIILNETGNVKVGYNKTCWVTDTFTRVWSVIVPLAVLYLVSILALTKTLLKIHFAKKQTRKTLQSDQGNADLVRIALKLIVGLGFIDVVGYIQVPDEDLMTLNLIFSVLFVLVRSLKGIFVCILYLCNRKVWRLYKGGAKDRYNASNASTCRNISLRRREEDSL